VIPKSHQKISSIQLKSVDSFETPCDLGMLYPFLSQHSPGQYWRKSTCYGGHLTQWCHSTDIDGRAQLCAVLRRTLHSVMPQYCSDIHIKETSQYHTWFGIGLKKLYQPILIILCGVTVLPSFGLYHSLLSATNKIQKDWNAVFLSIKVTHHLTKRLPAVPKNESNETHNMKLHVAKLLDMENS